MVTIGFVVGKHPTRSPVIGEVVAALRRSRAEVVVHVDDGTAPAWLDDVDVVAVRGLTDATLARLLLAERRGVRFCDPPGRVLLARDRRAVARLLRDSGVSAPDCLVAPTWSHVRGIAAERSGTAVAVKHRRSTVGRGVNVWLGEVDRLPEQAPFPGPYVVEEAVQEVRVEVKLYVIGTSASAFEVAAGRTIRPLAVDQSLRALAGRVADTLGLSLLGIDLLFGRDGAVVIDVNPFPSCRRVPDAAQLIAAHLWSCAGHGSGDPLMAAPRAVGA